MLCITQITVVEAYFSIYIFLRVILMCTKSAFVMFYYNARKQNCIYSDIFMRLSSCFYYFARPTRYFFFSIIVLHKEIRKPVSYRFVNYFFGRVTIWTSLG